MHIITVLSSFMINERYVLQKEYVHFIFVYLWFI
jgi:hypothetical protein